MCIFINECVVRVYHFMSLILLHITSPKVIVVNPVCPDRHSLG